MPPWFAKLVGQIESLSMDARADRERLWEVLSDNLPHGAVEHAVATHMEEWLVRVGGMTRDEVAEILAPLASGITACAMTAVTES